VSKTAKVSLQAVTVEPANGAPSYLVVRIEIDCEACGLAEYIIPGHHLRMFASYLQQVITEVDPKLTEPGTLVTLGPTRRFSITPEEN
jgi:hypothetical protein